MSDGSPNSMNVGMCATEFLKDVRLLFHAGLLERRKTLKTLEELLCGFRFEPKIYSMQCGRFTRLTMALTARIEFLTRTESFLFAVVSKPMLSPPVEACEADYVPPFSVNANV
jgi:hypothetical protein